MEHLRRGAIIFIIMALLPALSSAEEHHAASLNPADVQAAVNAASAGDWVVLPAGDNSNWTTTVYVPPGINLRGAGVSKTILRQPTGSSARFFSFNNSSLSHNYNLEVYGFKIVGPSGREGAPVWPTSSGTGYAIEIKKYPQIKIHDLEIHNKNYGIVTRDVKKGVIYECGFYWIINNYSSATHGTGGYGVCCYTSDPWPADYPAFGSGSQVYVEDCTFSGVKHATSNGATGRMVTRYCKIEKGWRSHCSLDAHGQRSGNESSLTTEFYNNEIWLASEGIYEPQGVAGGTSIRGGQAVMFNNKFHSGGGSSPGDSLGIHDMDISDAGIYAYPGDYPVYWQPRNIWVWGNTYDGSPVRASESSSWFEENRLSGGVYDYRNIQLSGYVPFSYPHPLRQTSQSLDASAAASPVSGQAPLKVNFSAQATGGTSPYTYSWNFGDGQSSGSQNPSHTYPLSGDYVASLTVRDSQGSQKADSVTIRVTATATDPLTATPSVSPTVGTAPLTVSYAAGASGGTPPYSYRWDFGDGNTSLALTGTHTYNLTGTYALILTVTDSAATTAISSTTIAVGTVSAFRLSLSSQTGAPAPGQGGTTDPVPGTHSFSVGASVHLKSIPNVDYRFSRWSGDVPAFGLFNTQAEVAMDSDKTVSATFCTKCADVNGDLLITPADAQAAFDIFLGKTAEPTWCERENADVNSSGSKLEPKVTPADAQLIFRKYLKKGAAGADCSGNSRGSAAAVETLVLPGPRLTLNQISFERGQEIAVPIILEASSDITAFGFDLSFPQEVLEFVGLERTEITAEFSQLEANVLFRKKPDNEARSAGNAATDFDQTAQDMLNYTALRVGGYKLTSTMQPVSGVLVTLIFRVTGEVEEEMPFGITAVFDDLQNASLMNGAIRRQQIRKDERQPRGFEKDIASKRFDF
jgi:PKD repeat protein